MVGDVNYNKALMRLKEILDNKDKDPQLLKILKAKRGVIKNFKPSFIHKNVKLLKELVFTNFLSFKFNRHWSNLERHKKTLVSHMDEVRNALFVLTDKSVQIESRIDNARGTTTYLGLGTLTPILMITDEKNYGVCNGMVRLFFKDYNLLPKISMETGNGYAKVNYILKKFSDDLHIGLWDVDALFSTYSKERKSAYAVPIYSEDAMNHMNDTLLNKVDIRLISKFVKKTPKFLPYNGGVNIWGLLPSKRNTDLWRNFKPQDIAIFVTSNGYLIASTIIDKVKDNKLAENLWGVDKNNDTRELIYFVNILNIIKMDKSSFLNKLNYNANHDLKDCTDITRKFNDAYSSLNDFLESCSDASMNPEEMSNDISEEILDYIQHSAKLSMDDLKKMAYKNANAGPSDYMEAKGRRIKRKAILVAYVKVRDNNECQACGCKITKADGGYYVEVAHIKPLSQGGPDNPSNMVSLCPNCHKKLDLGDDKEREDVISALKNKNGEYSGSL